MSDPVDKINAVAFHPTQPHIAAVGESPTVRIYDICQRKFIAFIPLPGHGTHACYSPDGRFLATATYDPNWDENDTEVPSAHQVCLWNAMDGYRLVKSDGFAIPQMISKIMKKNKIDYTKKQEIKKTMDCVKEQYFKLHAKKIIALQFIQPTVLIPENLLEQSETDKARKNGRNVASPSYIDHKYADSKHSDTKHSAMKGVSKNKKKEHVYRKIQVLFSASHELLRFWEYNPRVDDTRKTIPSEVEVDYGQGLRYLASLRHMDQIEVKKGNKIEALRHREYIAAKVSDDGRLLCTLDTVSRTACLVKLAYEKMMLKDDTKLGHRMNQPPRESERTISFPLILHKFEEHIQMLCLDFIPDANPPPPELKTGISNRVVGSYHVVFGGKSMNKDVKSMIESITLEMANKSMDNMLRSEGRPDEQELSPFILEASGVLSGSVRKLRVNMSKKIQISNNQETITRVNHASSFDGIIHTIRVSKDGKSIATGDEYKDGGAVNHVISSWTQIPNGFSRKSIGSHTGKINCIAFPGNEVLAMLQAHMKLGQEVGIILSCGDATIHAWKHRTVELKLTNMSDGKRDKLNDNGTLEPLLTIEHQITGQQKKHQMVSLNKFHIEILTNGAALYFMIICLCTFYTSTVLKRMIYASACVQRIRAVEKRAGGAIPLTLSRPPYL